MIKTEVFREHGQPGDWRLVSNVRCRVSQEQVDAITDMDADHRLPDVMEVHSADVRLVEYPEDLFVELSDGTYVIVGVDGDVSQAVEL